jgi:hypothetical protein
LAHRQEVGAHFLRRNVLGRLHNETESVAVKRESGLHILDCNSDVIENSSHFNIDSSRRHEDHDVF